MDKKTPYYLLKSTLGLVLAICLVFASISTSFLTESNWSGVNATTHIDKGFHSTNTSTNNLLAELIDIEEEDDVELKKSPSFLRSKELRVLWNYSVIEENSSKYNALFEQFIVSRKTEPYIEYCSLKIPS